MSYKLGKLAYGAAFLSQYSRLGSYETVVYIPIRNTAASRPDKQWLRVCKSGLEVATDNPESSIDASEDLVDLSDLLQKISTLIVEHMESLNDSKS